MQPHFDVFADGRNKQKRRARVRSATTRCYASANRRGRRAIYPTVCSKRVTLMGNGIAQNRKPQRARNWASAQNVGWPAIRAWGRLPLPNIGSVGGDSGPWGRRHRGRGRAVPERRPL